MNIRTENVKEVKFLSVTGPILISPALVYQYQLKNVILRAVAC